LSRNTVTRTICARRRCGSIVPYLRLGAVVLIWAVLIGRTPFPHTGLDYSQAKSLVIIEASVAEAPLCLRCVGSIPLRGAQVSIWII